MLMTNDLFRCTDEGPILQKIVFLQAHHHSYVVGHGRPHPDHHVVLFLLPVSGHHVAKQLIWKLDENVQTSGVRSKRSSASRAFDVRARGCPQYQHKVAEKQKE